MDIRDKKHRQLVCMNHKMEVGKAYKVKLITHGIVHETEAILCNEIKEHGPYSRSYFMTSGNGFIFQWQRRVLGYGTSQCIIGWEEVPLDKVKKHV